MAQTPPNDSVQWDWCTCSLKRINVTVPICSDSLRVCSPVVLQSRGKVPTLAVAAVKCDALRARKGLNEHGITRILAPGSLWSC